MTIQLVDNWKSEDEEVVEDSSLERSKKTVFLELHHLKMVNIQHNRTLEDIEVHSRERGGPRLAALFLPCYVDPSIVTTTIIYPLGGKVRRVHCFVVDDEREMTVTATTTIGLHADENYILIHSRSDKARNATNPTS